MAYRPASPSVPLSAYPIKGSIFHIDADGGAWDLLVYPGKKKEVFSINNADRGYQVIADVETGNQSVRSWSAAGGWTSVVALGGDSGSFLDKVTTSPQSVASAVTWAELQTMSKGLDITGAMAGGEAMRLPDNTWIRPQTAGQALYLTNGSTPGTTNSTIHLTSGGLLLGAGDGTGVHSQIQLSDGFAQIYSQSNGSILDNLFLGNNNTSLTTDSGRGLYLTSNSAQLVGTGSILLAVGGASYDNAAGHIFSGGPITPTLGAGPATSLLGRNAANEIVSAGTAPSGGFMGLSGHNDLGTTPWSFGNDTTWASSFVGYQVDPSGTYQAWIKGNLLIDQGVSNVATLYRQAFAVDSTICLMYDAQNNSGTQVRYAEACGQIKDGTAGAHDGEWYVKIAQNGAMVDRIRATQEGGIVSGIWRGDYSGLGMGTAASRFNYLTCYPKLLVDGATASTPMLQIEVDTTKVYQNYNTYYNGGWQAKNIAMPSAQVVFDTADGAFKWYSAPTGTPASLTQILTLSADGKLSTKVSTAASAGLNLGAFGVSVTSPVDGDVWKSAADTLSIRMSTNTRTIPFLQTAQTWSAVQTFSSTPVISSTTASTTAGAIYKRTGFGHVGYEAGMAQEFLANVYIGPVGTALTNSTTETDVTGGTAQFGARTTSTSVWQNGTKVRVETTAIVTNSAANTLTLRFKYGTTIVATITITSIVASATPISIWAEGVATNAPGASVETIWLCGVEGSTAVVAATAVGTITNLPTNAATAVSMTAQWTTALATSTYHTKATRINLV